MIKAIGTAARKELEKEFSKKVNLQLWVKANKNWTNDINKLKKFGLELIFEVFRRQRNRSNSFTK